MATDQIVLIGGGLLLSLLRQKNVEAAQTTLPGAPGTTAVQTVPASDGPSGAPISIAASGTGPTAPLATSTGVINGVPLSQVMDSKIQSIPPLALVLDNDTAVKLRAYAALNPTDFQVFLNRYADRVVMRDDLFFQMLTDPPKEGFQPTPTMLASMGPAAYKVVQGLNGVAAGNYGDLFGISSTLVGQIPGLDPNFVKAVQGLALGYRAYTATLTLAQLTEVAAANGVSLLNLSGTMLQSAGMSSTLAMAPIQSLSGVLMAVGLCVDIAFTIIGDAPDIQKAIDIALDAASLVCLFIPVVGWIIAIVIQLIKFLIDLFAADLFMRKERDRQRELIEAAHYGQELSPMFPMVANAYSPRELHAVIRQWGSWNCGGVRGVQMVFGVNLKAGNQFMIGGSLYTVPADNQLRFGQSGCYWYTGAYAALTDDEQAWILARYAAENGIVAEAAVGVSQELKDQFEGPAEQLVMARAEPMRNFVAHGLSLDQIDQIVAEYRAQPDLNALASFYGYEHWQDLLGLVLTHEWIAWASAVTHGTLTDFSQAYGYPTMYALRAGAFDPWMIYRDGFLEWDDLLAWTMRRMDPTIAAFYHEPNLEPSAEDLALIGPNDPISMVILRRVVAAERHLAAIDAANAAYAAERATVQDKAQAGWTISAPEAEILYPGEDEYSIQMRQFYAAQAYGGNGGG